MRGWFWWLIGQIWSRKVLLSVVVVELIAVLMVVLTDLFVLAGLYGLVGIGLNVFLGGSTPTRRSSI